MVLWGGFTNSCEKKRSKNRGEKEQYTHLNAEFQKIARRDKKTFLSEQWNEIEENNRMGKTRDLFKKLTDTKGTFHAKMGTIKYHIWNKSPVQVRCRILDAWSWCTGMTQRDGMGREEGGGFRMGNMCIPVADSCWYMAKPIQCFKVKNKIKYLKKGQKWYGPNRNKRY